jgi:hypothetical protein
MPWFIGGFLDTSSGKIIDRFSIDPKWPTADNRFYDKILLNKVKNKTQEIAWFVSQCNSPSQRTRLIKELQKYMKVDTYGKCGPFR